MIVKAIYRTCGPSSGNLRYFHTLIHILGTLNQQFVTGDEGLAVGPFREAHFDLQSERGTGFRGACGCRKLRPD